MATDLNGHGGHRTADEGAAIAVRLATVESSPTAGFFDDAGTVAW